MKLFTLSFALLLLCLPISAQESKPSIENLSWLSGCWESTKKDSNNLISEQWMKPAGQMMLGSSRTVKKNKTVGFEFLRIIQNDSGIFYISKPSENTEEGSFKLIKLNGNEVVFEDPTHDFPQRIIYRLEKDNSLFARIEGNNKGKFMGIDFLSTRVKCD
jgi:hypothetical protein